MTYLQCYYDEFRHDHRLKEQGKCILWYSRILIQGAENFRRESFLTSALCDVREGGISFNGLIVHAGARASAVILK